MLFLALPSVRQAVLVDFFRQRAAAVRRAAPYQPPLPVQRPLVSRFLIAGICAWLLLQPLNVRSESAITSPAAPAAELSLVDSTGKNSTESSSARAN